MNKRKPCAAGVFLVLFVVLPLRADFKFDANLDKTRIALDDQLILTISATGKDVSNSMPDPVVPALQDFRMVNKSASTTSSSSFQMIVNGKRTTQEAEKKRTWKYILAPKKAGNLHLPSFVLEFKGSRKATRPIQIPVTKESPESGDLIFRCIPQGRKVYLGEQLKCTIRIGIRDGSNVANPGLKPGFESEFKKDFWVEGPWNDQIKRRRETIKGVGYTITDVPISFTPVRSGTMTIPAIPLQYQVQKRVQRRQRSVFDDPFFGSFFGGVQREQKQKYSKPVRVTVLPLPDSPAAFSGSVGSFSLSANLDRVSVAAGDALTYTMVLQGSCALQNIKDPEIPQLNGFDVFEPEKKSNSRVRNGVVWGKREYKYVLIPQREGEFTIPPASYVFFDTKAKTYKKLESKGFPVTVTPGKQRTSVAGSRPMMSKREIRELGRDIRFIKSGNMRIEDQSRPLHRNPLFLFLQVIPALTVAGAYLFQKQRVRLTRDVGYARRIRSKRLVRKRLAEARGHLGQGHGAAYYGALSKGIVDYVGDLFNVASIGMTAEAIRDLLVDAGQDMAVVEGVSDLLEKADFARFATSDVPSTDMEADLAKAEALLGQFQLKKGKT